ncbi:MAG: 50S ribosomal protein L4 [Candidatus Shapirobacteria bacterium]|jgi:large subunit ribosomal protein L4
MKTQLYDINAKQIGEITLPSTVFGAQISEQLISNSIRTSLSNKRSALAKTKHRGEVAGTTKKMWAQKGTGRARHGSAKAPIFVGGGSAHGPRGERNFDTKVNSKARKMAVNSILSKFAKNKSILVVEKLNTISPKTKEGIKLITGLKGVNEVLSKSSKVGIISSKTLVNVRRAFGNIPKVRLLSLKSLNVLDLSNQNSLIFTKRAIEQLTK